MTNIWGVKRRLTSIFNIYILDIKKIQITNVCTNGEKYDDIYWGRRIAFVVPADGLFGSSTIATSRHLL